MTDTTNTNTEVETEKEDKRKNPHKVNFVPASQEALDAAAVAGHIEYVEIPERKTKSGVKPAYKLALAKDPAGQAILFNNNQKAMRYWLSFIANSLTNTYQETHSPEKMAAKVEKKAEKKVSNMDDATLAALYAAMQKRLEAAAKATQAATS